MLRRTFQVATPSWPTIAAGGILLIASCTSVPNESLSAHSARYSARQLDRLRSASVSTEGRTSIQTVNCTGTFAIKTSFAGFIRPLSNVSSVYRHENFAIGVLADPFRNGSILIGEKQVSIHPLACAASASGYGRSDLHDNKLDPNKITGFRYNARLTCNPSLSKRTIVQLSVQDGSVEPRRVSCPGSDTVVRIHVNYDPSVRDIIGDPNIGTLVLSDGRHSCVGAFGYEAATDR